MQDDVRLYSVNSTHIDKVWPLAAPLIERSLKHAHGKYKIEDILESIIDKNMLLWVIFNNDELSAAFVTICLEYPQERTLQIDFCGGKDHKKWVGKVWDVLSEYARFHGCKAMEIPGREGWDRAITPYGFKKSHCIFRVLL